MKIKGNQPVNKQVQAKSAKSPVQKGQTSRQSSLNSQLVTERVANDAVVSKQRGVPPAQKAEKIKSLKEAKELGKKLASDIAGEETALDIHDISFDSIRHLLFE